MIEKLFSSKARVAILKLFLLNPEDNFYQRQISLLTNQPIRGVQRELEKLKKIGLIQALSQGNRIYYKVEKRCPIFEELKNIIMKSVGIAHALKENLKENGIKIAFIYGSCAKGQESLLSDIDVMVIGDISSRALSGILAKPKEELRREINYTVFSEQECRQRIKQKDHFFTTVLKDKKLFIVGDDDALKTIIRPGKTTAS